MRIINADECKAKLRELKKIYKGDIPMYKVHRNTIDDCIDLLDECPTIDAVFCTNCGALVNRGNEQMDRKVKGLRISFKEPKEVMASRAQALFYGAALYTEYFIKDGFLMIVDGETLIAMYALDEIFSVKLIFEGEPEFEGEVV